MPNRTQDSATKRAPQGNTGRAGADGLVGVFRTLAEQHDQVAALFEQLQEQPESRALLWPQLRRELVSHEHAEVRELYPVLRQLAATRALADHHDDEARELDAMISRLDTLDIQSDDWTTLFDALVDTVIHHAKDEEEAKIFPAAQQALGEPRAIELDAKVLAAKQQLMETH
jgi:hemerythrin superfamily protein